MMEKTLSNHNEELEGAFYKILADGRREDTPYDYLMLFSGGKDSTYLAHKLKQAKGGRVCLFTVENGFEDANFISHVKETAYKLGCDLYIYQPPQEQFIQYYRYLITEPALREIDQNPLCFFCGRYFLSLGIEFAERMNIPFAFYGATPEQINQGRKVRSLRDIEIFQMVSKRVFMGHYKKVHTLAAYRKNKVLKEIFDKVFHFSRTVTFQFPFQFLKYDVEYMKKTLENEYGWTNPTEGLDNSDYLTSGCQLVRLFGILSGKMGFNPHELKQFKRDFETGTVSKEAYEYNRNLFETIMKGEKTGLVRDLVGRLSLEKELLS